MGIIVRVFGVGYVKHLTFNTVSLVSERPSVILNYLLKHLKNNGQFLPIVTFNISMVHLFKHKPFMDWYNHSALFIADGISMSFIAFLRFFTWVQRYPGIDLVHDLLSQSQSLRIALVGARQQQLLGAIDYISKQFPTHHIVYHQNGFKSFERDDF